MHCYLYASLHLQHNCCYSSHCGVKKHTFKRGSTTMLASTSYSLLNGACCCAAWQVSGVPPNMPDFSVRDLQFILTFTREFV
jgi:hypothetical protein